LFREEWRWREERIILTERNERSVQQKHETHHRGSFDKTYWKLYYLIPIVFCVLNAPGIQLRGTIISFAVYRLLCPPPGTESGDSGKDREREKERFSSV